ncbi:MAG: cytochrome c [Gemmatimonadaceae bacterium]|nr:cytochrome c [Gemmatimonadaceae bacterium]
MSADLRIGRRALVALAPLALGACSWFTDFRDQPAIQPWETTADTIAPRGQPQNSVPVTGRLTPGYTISYTALPAVIDSFSGFANPNPVSDSSLANGRRHYQVNCAVCHGDAGMGNGPATKYGVPGISIIYDGTKARTDGYIYGMLRNGRGVMPSYNRIEEPDRWDVVNYVRALQGRIDTTRFAVKKGPIGYPGQGGWTVPTYSLTAPTRPAPYRGAAPVAQPTPERAAETTTRSGDVVPPGKTK